MGAVSRFITGQKRIVDIGFCDACGRPMTAQFEMAETLPPEITKAAALAAAQENMPSLCGLDKCLYEVP